MINTFAFDGKRFDDSLIASRGFNLNINRDIKEVFIYDFTTGLRTDKTEVVFNFVGFTTNTKDELLVVFPKNYNVQNKENDARDIFKSIFKHRQNRPDQYIGEKNDIIFDSNYPFSSFFAIYNYYLSYGLYFEDLTVISPNSNGRISWKETISRCEKYLYNSFVVMHPLYFRRKYYFSNFVTECMIFAIDYTISKFGIFLDADMIGDEFEEFDFLDDKKHIINVLEHLRQQTFKDIEQELIDNLIDFFDQINIGGDFYLKHYSYSSVWEDMVTEYLCKFYKGISFNHEIVFDCIASNQFNFSKRIFHPNKAKPTQYISPDHYCDNANKQCIFDAKYYTSVKGMDYKQIAYMFMLNGIVDISTGIKKFNNTYCALLLPSKSRYTKIHFQLDAEFGGTSDLLITEEYMDIKHVIAEYVV